MTISKTLYSKHITHLLTNTVFNGIGLLLCLLAIAGCTSKPTVHIYGKYIAPSQVQSLSESLSEKGLNVEVNDFEFPTTITSNTLLYSLLLQAPEAIDYATDAAQSSGLPINSVQPLSQGNHWYTKNSLAVFLFPDGKRPKGTLLAQDLVHSYVSKKCGDGQRLRLNKDGTYQLTLEIDKSIVSAQGHWKYRQFPYLELRELNSPYANYYFEISRELSEDQVSKLSLIHLQLLNANSANPLAPECVFTHGVRI